MCGNYFCVVVYCLFLLLLKMGFNLDLGVKTTDASEEDPREFLSAQMTAKYAIFISTRTLYNK